MSDDALPPPASNIVPLPAGRSGKSADGKHDPLSNGAAPNGVANPAGFAILDPPPDTAAEVARLAALDPVRYDNERAAAAERLGCRVSTLDEAVAAARPKADAAHGRGVALPEHEPWPQAVVLADALNSFSSLIKRHVVVSDFAADGIALWVAHTWLYEKFEHTPRLSVTSPAKRCGKSTLLEVLRLTCCRPLKADNISAAGTFRTVEALAPLTLLIDEADTFLGENEELRGILNSGFARGGEVIRVVEVKDEFQPVRFRTFCPVALAGIGELPGTLEDRSLPIVLQRKAAAEAVVKLREPGARAALHDVGRKLARWAADRGAAVSTCPAVPDALGDREGDVSVPLLAVAADAAGDWPQRARTALLHLFGVRTADEGGAETGALLLADIRAAFAERGATRLPSEELCEGLAKLEHRPWPEWRHGKPMTPAQLARVLKPFGVKPDVYRPPGAAKVVRGYQRDHFADVWTRYLTPLSAEAPLPNRNTRNTPENAGVSGFSDPKQAGAVLRVDKANFINENSDVTGVTGRNPPLEAEGYVSGPEAGLDGEWEASL